MRLFAFALPPVLDYSFRVNAFRQRRRSVRALF